MRKFLIAALLPLAACGNNADEGEGIPGTGSGDARSYAASGFTRVAAAGSDAVDVRVGPAFSVRAEGDSAVLDRLKIERDGDALKIGRRSGGFFSSGSARVFVTMPALSGASLAGSGDMTIDRAQGEKLDARIAGSGNITFAQVAVGAATFAIAGSGDIAVAGTAGELEVSIAGSGDVTVVQAVGDIDVSIAGSGDVRVLGGVSQDLDVSIAGSGNVDHRGEVRNVSGSFMGAGDVRVARATGSVERSAMGSGRITVGEN